mmetsp:Transcript_28195/g.73916  ORF Transcript_28195/g.73916 Transcript_28195/m.73916 type:complete len:283 (+) Transcript_28195:480-1328(+)
MVHIPPGLSGDWALTVHLGCRMGLHAAVRSDGGGRGDAAVPRWPTHLGAIAGRPRRGQARCPRQLCRCAPSRFLDSLDCDRRTQEDEAPCWGVVRTQLPGAGPSGDLAGRDGGRDGPRRRRPRGSLRPARHPRRHGLGALDRRGSVHRQRGCHRSEPARRRCGPGPRGRRRRRCWCWCWCGGHRVTGRLAPTAAAHPAAAGARSHGRAVLCAAAADVHAAAVRRGGRRPAKRRVLLCGVPRRASPLPGPPHADTAHCGCIQPGHLDLIVYAVGTAVAAHVRG